MAEHSEQQGHESVGQRREFPSRPWVGVGVVVFAGEHVLLVRRAKPPQAGQWSLPGGAQYLGETVFQTAIREVQEETRILIRPLSIITVVDRIERSADGRVRWHYTLVEVLAEASTLVPAAGDDAAAAIWASPGALRQLVAARQTVEVIDAARVIREHQTNHTIAP